jgi:hypothetical protein
MKPEGRVHTPTVKVRENLANADLVPVKKKAKIAKTPQQIPEPKLSKAKVSKLKAQLKAKLLTISIPEPEVPAESEVADLPIENPDSYENTNLPQQPMVEPTETILVHRGAAFQTLEKLKDANVSNAVKTLDFALYYLANRSPIDAVIGPRVEVTVMEACPKLREVIIDMSVDDLLFSKTSAGGEFMGWDSTPIAIIINRYTLLTVAHLPELQALKYRLVGASWAWKKHFAEPTLDKMKEWFSEQTMGRISVESLGFVGNQDGGTIGRIPTERGDGLSNIIAAQKRD